MPRIKASPKKCVKTTNSQQGSNTWVFLLKGEALEVPEGTPDVVQLRHPQSGAPAMFLFSPGDGMVQEVLTFSENRRSWFIDESVKSDGKMHLSTPIDPIFLVLPYLRKASHAMPLDQLLKDDEFPETERLLRSTGLKHLNQVADRKGDEDLNAYKYNEDKALSWLQRKTERVAEVLKQKGVHVSGGAVSATFVKGGKQDAPDTESYLKYAHGIVSEYLTDDLSAKLLQHMGLPEDKPSESSSKRKLAVSQTATPEKKPKSQEEVANGGVLDLTKPEKASKTSITSKDKARAKAAVGSKNISAFFKKK
ncbi:ribonuclease H2 subunit B isoform X2 [Anabrus simplex]|uniref:ribonuclease H2 subunit B isoform X2 n=1 Tax=Anabrus simplex TaxID=316456 RepID=UPI0034DDA772